MQKTNGPSNEIVEQRTWEWFSSAVAQKYGPAHYKVIDNGSNNSWPDITCMRASEKVGFEITSPLLPEDVMGNGKESADPDPDPDPDSPKDDHVERQKLLEKRVLGAIKRKVKKYGDKETKVPLALLITLAHPASLKFSSTKTDYPKLMRVVKSHMGNFLHQPIDAVYLVGPGEHARLLWLRRGPQWKKLFPHLDTVIEYKKQENSDSTQAGNYQHGI